MSGGHGAHVEGGNKGVALLIAILALILALSETGAKNSEHESHSANIEATNLWNFFQAKTIRRTTLQTAGEDAIARLPGVADPAVKAATEKQIAIWKAAADRYESEPETQEGRRELSARAKKAEDKRDLSNTKRHHFELASALLQIAIVLCSAMIITGIVWLVWFACGLGVVAVAFSIIALVAPNAVHLF